VEILTREINQGKFFITDLDPYRISTSIEFSLN